MKVELYGIYSRILKTVEVADKREGAAVAGQGMGHPSCRSASVIDEGGSVVYAIGHDPFSSGICLVFPTGWKRRG